MRDLDSRRAHDIGDFCDRLFDTVNRPRANAVIEITRQIKQSTRDGERANNGSPVNNGD